MATKAPTLAELAAAEEQRKKEDAAFAAEQAEAERVLAEQEEHNKALLAALDDTPESVRQNRSSREADSRDLDMRPGSYRPPEALPSPPPRQGVGYRWVRTSTLGTADNTNMAKRQHDGFRPVSAESMPDFVATLGHLARNDSTSDIIEVGGLILCEAPTHKLRERELYYEKVNRGHRMTNNQEAESIKASADPRMPVFIERTFS